MERRWIEAKWAPTKGVRVGHYVSMSKAGVIVFNKFTNEALRSPEAVMVLFDEVNNTLGLKSAHPRADNSYPVKSNGRAGGRRIRAGHAANQFGIQFSGTVRFLEPRFGDNEVLMLDLRNVLPVSNGRKGEKLKRKN